MSNASKKSKTSASKADSVARHSSPKVFDVMRPGRALASATSRPVITGHKPKVEDPVLTASRPAQSGSRTIVAKKTRIADHSDEPAQLMDPSKKVAVQPVETAQTAGEARAPVQPVATAASAATEIPAVIIDSDDMPIIQGGTAETLQQTQPVSIQGTAVPDVQHSSYQASTPPSMIDAAPSSQPSAAKDQKADVIVADTSAPIIDMSKAVISQHLGKSRRSPWPFIIILLILLALVITLLFIYL